MVVAIFSFFLGSSWAYGMAAFGMGHGMGYTSVLRYVTDYEGRAGHGHDRSWGMGMCS